MAESTLADIVCLEPTEQKISLEEVTADWSFGYSENLEKRERHELNIVLHSTSATDIRSVATPPPPPIYERKLTESLRSQQ